MAVGCNAAGNNLAAAPRVALLISAAAADRWASPMQRLGSGMCATCAGTRTVQHEEQLFMIDLEKAQDAELSKGLADKLYDREIK